MRNSIIDYVQSYRPKAFPPVMSALLELTHNPRADIAQIVNVIRQDPSIAIRVLSLANSAAYTPSTPVQTIKQAVINLGVDTIRNLVLTITVYDQVTRPDTDYNKDLLTWQHSIATALIASLLAKSRGFSNEQIDQLFMLGMLHDIGKIILHNFQTQNAIATSEEIDSKYISISEYELNHFGITHGEIASLLLKHWNIPNAITSLIRNHHLPMSQLQFKNADLKQCASILNTSDIISKCLLLGVTDNTILRPFSVINNDLNINLDDLNRIRHIVPMQTYDLLDSMSQAEKLSNRIPSSKRYQSACLIPPSPLCMNTKPEHNTFAITCMSLNPSNTKPNFRLIHNSQHTKSNHILDSPLINRIKKQNKLPAIYLTDHHLLPPQHHDENAMTIQTPIQLKHFIEALNLCLSSKKQLTSSH